MIRKMADAKFSRYVMYNAIEDWAANHPILTATPKDKKEGKVIGGGSQLVQLWPKVSWEVTNYPNVDAMNLPWEDASVDILLSDQMLEHVPKPWKAADEMIRVLKPGGLLICTTCFMQRWHPPATYFNFHPDGLKSLFDHNLTTITAGGWGHRLVNDIFNYNPEEKMWRNLKIHDKPILKDMAEDNDPKSPFSSCILGVK